MDGLFDKYAQLWELTVFFELNRLLFSFNTGAYDITDRFKGTRYSQRPTMKLYNRYIKYV